MECVTRKGPVIRGKGCFLGINRKGDARDPSAFAWSCQKITTATIIIMLGKRLLSGGGAGKGAEHGGVGHCSNSGWGEPCWLFCGI